MKICIVHSFYSGKQPSGENRVVEIQARALAENGHDVLLVRSDTDQHTGATYPLKSAFRVATGHGHSPRAALDKFSPDVVHIHNLFPNFGVNWIREWQGPKVMTLHNYRLFCSKGTFYRNGSICTKCPDKGQVWSTLHGCYRDSMLATLPLTMSRSQTQRIVLNHIHTVISLSEVSQGLLQTYLGPDVPTALIPNFIPDDASIADQNQLGDYWFAMGRFSPEKGMAELARDWPPNEQLVIDGFGAQEKEIRAAASGKRIVVQSTLDRQELNAALHSAKALIFPSQWFDVDPLVIPEAMQAGLPVIAFHNNSAANLVRDTGAGAIYGSPDSLKRALQKVSDHRSQMSNAARALFEERWTRRAWLTKMNILYKKVAGR